MDSFENTLRTAANLQEAKRQELKATKHTPGPWTANWSTATNGGPERGWFVESESDRYAYGAIAELPDGREEANARLIAAAPELLEVCKGLLAAIRDRFPGIEKQVETAAGLQSEYHCAVAAIAKAEGR